MVTLDIQLASFSLCFVPPTSAVLSNMERALSNRAKGGAQRLFVMPDNLDAKRNTQTAVQQKSALLKRSAPVEDKENVNPDTFELAQHESRQRRMRLPQYTNNGDGNTSFKPSDEVVTPQDCKSRPPLRDITPIFQKVSSTELICLN